MKKLMIAACVAALGLAAPAACTWDWWFGNADKDIQGCALGLGSANKDVTGAQISVCASKAENVKAGCQGAIGYSEVKTLRNGAQFAFINKADHAALQFGLVCFNKGGFLPWFVFFNFDKTMFGSGK